MTQIPQLRLPLEKILKDSCLHHKDREKAKQKEAKKKNAKAEVLASQVLCYLKVL